MAILKGAKLALAFLLELCALAALGYWGFHTGRGTLAKGKPLTFLTQGAGKPSDVTFIPFYRLAHERYTIYIKQATPSEWAKTETEMRAKEAAQRELDARTVDQINPGEQQPYPSHRAAGGQRERI